MVDIRRILCALIEKAQHGCSFGNYYFLCENSPNYYKNKNIKYNLRLPVPGHFYSCVVSKYLLRENEISFLL